MRSVLTLSALCAVAVGCGGDYNNGGTPVSNPCNPPAQSSYAPTVIYDILPNADTQLSGSNPAYAITSNGQGTYTLFWSDPSGAATCFTGLVTLADPFASPPQAQDNTTAVLNNPAQLAFSGVPGSDVDGVTFDAGSDVVNVEAYTDANADIDFSYTDNGTGAVALTASNVAAFQSP